jgi:hypothetical protein
VGWGISLLGERLLVSQEGFCPVELVSCHNFYPKLCGGCGNV